ncbi:MAG: O-antigen ligase family protein [Dehalococcoidia bacterium]|nr:O-antigen ligase family protein [Dehalococcoidia bacterium]
MFELAVLIAVEAVLLGAVVVLREPKLLVPCVILGLPIEWLETRMVDSLGSSGAAGAVRSLLNPGQAAMAATIAVAIFRERHTPLRLIPNSSLLVPVGMLFALLFLGVAWSDNPRRPENSVLILPLYFGFIMAAPSLIEDKRDVRRIIGAFLIAAIVLSLLAIAQRLLGVFNWRTILVQSDDYSYRSNATFADPNNLARFLAISMSLAAGLILTLGPRRLTVYLAVPAFAIGSLAIVATASRSGWIALLLIGFVVVVTAPIARYTKARLTISAFGGLAIALTLLFMQGGTDAERVKSLTSGVQAIGQREFLIRAGWEMFKDNPIVGVGSGNYQHALIISYLHLIPDWARTTLSHTSTVSIMAELGLVGIFAFAFVGLRLLMTVVATYYRSGDMELRLMAGWLGAAFLGILFQSQSEGRLLDEPFLWLLMALLIAFETRPALWGRAAEQEVAPVARRASAVPAASPVRARGEQPGGQGAPVPAGGD